MKSAIIHLVSITDRLNRAIGDVVRWCAVVLVLVQFAVVLLRYVFGFGAVAFHDLTIWAHGLIFLLGAGALLARDGHVRVDIWQRDAAPLVKARIDLFGSLFCLIPMAIVVAWLGGSYAAASWRVLEGARDIGGLPGVFLLKSTVPLFGVLIGLQGIAIACRSVTVMMEGSPRAPEGDERR